MNFAKDGIKTIMNYFIDGLRCETYNPPYIFNEIKPHNINLYLNIIYHNHKNSLHNEDDTILISFSKFKKNIKLKYHFIAKKKETKTEYKFLIFDVSNLYKSIKYIIIAENSTTGELYISSFKNKSYIGRMLPILSK